MNKEYLPNTNIHKFAPGLKLLIMSSRIQLFNYNNISLVSQSGYNNIVEVMNKNTDYNIHLLAQGIPHQRYATSTYKNFGSSALIIPVLFIKKFN